MNPYRTLLFVPANRQKMLDKAPTLSVDALLPDLEDAVPKHEKDGARSTLAAYIPSLQGRPVFVRVNAVQTGQTLADLQAIVGPGLSGIFLPKTESADEVKQVAAWLDDLERRAGVPRGQIEIVAMLESALGILRGYEIATASPRVASLSFASGENGDLQTDLGCDWSQEGIEMLYARSKLIVDARAAGIDWPLDGVHVDLQNEQGLIADTTLSKRLGYKGRTVIHPSQIAPVNAIYTPAPAEVDYYRRLIAAFDAAIAENKASVSFEGKMIDYAMVGRARRVLAVAERLPA